jgi:hypothetical protein
MVVQAEKAGQNDGATPRRTQARRERTTAKSFITSIAKLFRLSN